MAEPAALTIEVAYATAKRQLVLAVTVEAGATIEQAIRQSGILEHFPDIDLNRNPVGIFGQLCALDTPLHAGDRIEIYRPLVVDPKEARRRRAASTKN